MNEKDYRGVKRWGSGDTEVYVREKGEERILELRLDLRSHSPTGFNWGYGGSGPAQLALALLVDASNDNDLALEYYQRFKDEVVAGWPSNSHWKVDQNTILRWLDAVIGRTRDREYQPS